MDPCMQKHLFKYFTESVRKPFLKCSFTCIQGGSREIRKFDIGEAVEIRIELFMWIGQYPKMFRGIHLPPLPQPASSLKWLRIF